MDNHEFMDGNDRARKDALEDIFTESDDCGEMVEHYFGSAIVQNPSKNKTELVNLLIPGDICYNGAVGSAWLDLRERFPANDGWVISNLLIEEFPVFLPPDDEIDEEFPNMDVELDVESD